VGELERRIVRVVAPADEPGRGLDQGKVPVVVEGSIDLVGRLEDVELLHRIYFGGGAEARLEDAGRDVVARADAGRQDQDALAHELMLVPWKGSSLALGDVQVRASQGRRGRDTGSYPDRGERREVRAWAPRSAKRFPFQDTRTRGREECPL